MGHTWSNPFDEPAIVVIADDELVSKKTGLPGFLQVALLLNAYREELGAPGIAGSALQVLSAALAPIARARGYLARYEQYVDADAP